MLHSMVRYGGTKTREVERIFVVARVVLEASHFFRLARFFSLSLVVELPCRSRDAKYTPHPFYKKFYSFLLSRYVPLLLFARHSTPPCFVSCCIWFLSTAAFQNVLAPPPASRNAGRDSFIIAQTDRVLSCVSIKQSIDSHLSQSLAPWSFRSVHFFHV